MNKSKTIILRVTELELKLIEDFQKSFQIKNKSQAVRALIHHSLGKSLKFSNVSNYFKK